MAIMMEKSKGKSLLAIFLENVSMFWWQLCLSANS